MNFGSAFGESWTMDPFIMLFRIFCLTACVWVQTMGQFSVALKLLALLQQYKENTEEAEVVP